MPESDLLMEFILGYGFHFKPQGLFNAAMKKKGKEKPKMF